MRIRTEILFLALGYGLTATAERAMAVTPDTDLSGLLTVQQVLQLTLAQNPRLSEAEAHVFAAETRQRQAGRWADPELKYEQWGVPLQRPYDLGHGNAVMLGVRQSFPAPGSGAARTRMAQNQAEAARTNIAKRRLDLQVEVKRAFADYFRADRELRLHKDHVGLTDRLVDLARASYRTGTRGQEDVLRLVLELSRVHRDLAHIEQERLSAQAALNMLMNRAPDAALGPPAELVVPDAATKGGPGRRPELDAAAATVRAGQNGLDLAKIEARWPTLMLGLDYMYMPAMEAPHGYGAMAAVSVPWLSSGRKDAIALAEAEIRAARHAHDVTAAVVTFEATDAQAKFKAAQSTMHLVVTDLLPQAERNLEAARAAYATGKGDVVLLVDALRMFLDTRGEKIRSQVHVAVAAADLQRARGLEDGTP